jgi:hypothetical protein
MIPLVKLVSLSTRILSRPAANFVTKQLRTSTTSLPGLFAKLGRGSTAVIADFENRLRRDKGEQEIQIPELSDQQAKDAGIELAVEIAMYLAVFGVGYYEVRRYAQEAKKKEDSQVLEMEGLHSELALLHRQLESLKQTVQDLK